ncbi:MAG: hypothetical protein JO182_22840 [Acidobacteriaceae bacterium]|nr:hypothetical protein [Acidobacteriaceae bacterium]
MSTTSGGSGTCPSLNYQGPYLGILSTPVIDPNAKTLYAVRASGVRGSYTHYLHALDITTGQDKQSAVTIQANVAGSGYNAKSGRVYLGSGTEVQRTALLLANGTVYAGFGNCGPDADPWHGWVVGYSASNLQRKFVFNSTPNGGQGGIWQSGRGLVPDASGNIYLATGNSTVYNSNDANVTTGDPSKDAAKGDYPMRVVQLSSAGAFQTSYPPPNYPSLNNNDLDFSSSGPLLVPGANLLVAGGKDGMVYTFNTPNFGNPVQNFQATGTGTCPYSEDGCDQIHDLAFWNNRLYVWGSHDVLRSFVFNPSNNTFSTSPDSQNTITVGYTPATIAVSGNGTQSGTGIVWSVTPDSVLHAFDAGKVGTELWNSTQNSNDSLPSFVRFVEPTVANGRVYVPTGSNQLVVYGILGQFSVSASPSSLSVQQGNSTSFAVNVGSLGGFDGTVNLSISGLPANATASFNPSSVTGSGSSTVTITTAASTPTGTSSLVVSANAPGINQTRTANVALTVTSSDTTPPTATCCTYTTNSDGSYTLNYTGQDTGSGMQSIVPVQLVNATASIPSFQVGTTDVIPWTATEYGFGSYAQFQLTDVAGNSAFIDPIFYDSGKQPLRQTGEPQPFEVKNICKANVCKYVTNTGGTAMDRYGEGTVTIQNGPSGLKNLRIQANNGENLGQIEVAGMHDNETRIVDISSILPNAGPVTVQLTPLGKPGGTAIIIFGPGPVTPAP